MPSILTSGTIVPWNPIYFNPNPMDWTAWVLAFLYLLITIWPLVQLIRLHKRIPGGPWTTQKMFFLLSVVANLVRMAFFVTVPLVRRGYFFGEHDITRYTVFTIFDDLPCDVYYTTYTLLILFWCVGVYISIPFSFFYLLPNRAEVIQHAKDRNPSSSTNLRHIFVGSNIVVYAVQIIVWILIIALPGYVGILNMIDNIFFTIISLVAALGFVVFGGRLYLMLKSFPIESKSRQRKLREVGIVAAICTTCFVVRSGLLIDAMVNDTEQPGHELSFIFILVFFFSVEVLPSALVLYMLRHLPSPRPAIIDTGSQYGTASEVGVGASDSVHRPLVPAVYDVPVPQTSKSNVKRWFAHSLNADVR